MIFHLTLYGSYLGVLMFRLFNERTANIGSPDPGWKGTALNRCEPGDMWAVDRLQTATVTATVMVPHLSCL